MEEEQKKMGVVIINRLQFRHTEAEDWSNHSFGNEEWLITGSASEEAYILIDRWGIRNVRLVITFDVMDTK
jgi:hypothetical protein